MYSLENGLSETYSQDDEDVTTCVQGQSDVPGKSERFVESSVDPELLCVAKARISAQMVFSLSCQMSLPSFCSFFLNWCCCQAAKSQETWLFQDALQDVKSCPAALVVAAGILMLFEVTFTYSFGALALGETAARDGVSMSSTPTARQEPTWNTSGISTGCTCTNVR